MSRTIREILFWLCILIGAIFLYRFLAEPDSLSPGSLASIVLIPLMGLFVLSVGFVLVARIFRFQKPIFGLMTELAFLLFKYNKRMAASLEKSKSNAIHPLLKLGASVVFFFNAAMLDALLKRIKEQQASQKKELSMTIVGLLVGRKAKQNTVAYLCLFLSLELYSLGPMRFNYKIRWEVLLVMAGLIVALFINQKILEYRILKGFYGTNEYEARELLAFVMSHAGDSKTSGGTGLKERSIFLAPEEDVEMDAATDSLPGAEGAKA